MERFFQADFSRIRVHQGPAARVMGALAFTLGEEIHFAPGLYDPSTREGMALLGHELTHVVQQREGRVANPYGHGVAIVQDPALEAEADRMGQQIAEQLWPGSPGPAHAASARMALPRGATAPRATLARAVQRMESSGHSEKMPPSTTQGTSSGARTPAVLTGEEATGCLVLVSLQTQEAQQFADFRQQCLATLFPGPKPSILVLSEPTIFDLAADPNARALEPLYRDLGTVLVTRFELQQPLLRIGGTPVVGESIFLDATKPFPPFVRGRDLILMRRGLCYCGAPEACCGVSRQGQRDTAFLLQVGRALSPRKNAFAMLGSKLAACDADDSYANWSAAAAEAMTADPWITVVLVVHVHKTLGALFVGLKVTYDPQHASTPGPSFADLQGRVVLDLSYDQLSLDTHPEPSIDPTFTNSKLDL